MTYSLGLRSKQNLSGVHADLRKIVERAIQLTKTDFTIMEGIRNSERQKQLVAQGSSKTLHSRHITGHAIDIGVWRNGAVDWEDKDANKTGYKEVGRAMKAAAKELGLPLRWGADWDGDGKHSDETFLDWGHFELPRASYP